MSAEDPHQPTPNETAQDVPARQPRRLGIGMNVALQVLLLLAIFLAVNRVSYRHHRRWDLSPQGSFTLSGATLNFLGKLSKEVFIANIIARDDPLFGETQSLLEEYRIQGGGRVKVRSIDPLRDIERAEALKVETGLSLDQPGIIVRCEKRTRFIRREELVLRENGTETQRAIKEFRGEDAVTSAVVHVVEGSQRRLYFVVGKGARSEETFLQSVQSLGELGRQQNFQLFALNLAEVSAVPADADGVILLGLRYDLSLRELDLLKAYWQRQRSGLLVLLDPAGETPRLDAMLGLNGVMPRNDRVLYAESTRSGPRKEFVVQAVFDRESPITRPMATSATSLPGQTRSLEVRQDDEQVKAANIEAFPLMAATERFWAERNHVEELPVADGADVTRDVFLAASIERGSVHDERLKVESCRMVVVGNSTLLEPQSALAVNRDFVASALNWMLSRERLIGITPKPRRNYRVELSPTQNEVIFWSSTVVLPALVLCLGLMVWSSRRNS